MSVAFRRHSSVSFPTELCLRRGRSAWDNWEAYSTMTSRFTTSLTPGAAHAVSTASSMAV